VLTTECAYARLIMSKFRQGYSREQSPLFDGDTIFKQLNNSSFGRFQAAMQSVKSYLPTSHFQLPKVIVIGGKSAGKSSLLENITKCHEIETCAQNGLSSCNSSKLHQLKKPPCKCCTKITGSPCRRRMPFLEKWTG